MTDFYDRRGNSITLSEWTDLRKTPDRRVTRSVIQCEGETADVVTIWTGFDSQDDEDGPPLIFETMVFGGKYDQYQMAHSTEEEALMEHKRICGLVRGDEENDG